MRDLLEMTTAPLGVVTSLFGRLHAEDIAYCHWKSNEHLDASMAGDTDFDLLVDRKAAVPLAGILHQIDAKRFVVEPFHRYPGVEDYIAYDRDSGKLIHLHIHYQLTVGEKLLKGHHLPWEELVLSTRMLEERHEIYVADPNVEMLLLVVRAAMKLRVRDRLRAALGGTYLQGKARKEFDWLARRIDRERLREFAHPLVGERATRILVDMVGGPAPSQRQLLAFRRSAEPDLSTYRMYGAWGSRPRRWLRELRTLWWVATNRYYHVPRNSSRTSPHGGCMIAFVGVRAAGTSVASEIAVWLAGEVAVLPVAAAPGVPARAWRARSLGKIVIVDGWPQAEASPPDVVVRLRGGVNVATAATHQFPAATRVVDVDADRPLEHVLSDVKHTVWESL